ncbi:MAG TPA: DUF202 domain-containing protein [Acidimicrobiia bacterium]|nr:DUF202 domain-containing protein [Acidimicrobiia bacterium]
MTGYQPEAREPGLAAERTDLAWDRSGLGLLACGAVVMRGIARRPLVTGEIVVGACIVGLGGFIWALGAWYARRVRSSGRPASASDLLPVSLGVAGIGVAAFVIAALFPS